LNSIPTATKRKKRTEFERRLVFAKTAGRCIYCWDELDFIWDFVCDHYIPLSRGGADDHSNLVPACYFCDNRKRSFLPTPVLCQTLKKWKRGELVPKVYIDLPDAISKEKLTRGQRRQIQRYKQSRQAQTAWEEYKRTHKGQSGFIPNPALPWHILGNHAKHFYGQRRADSSTEEGTGGNASSVDGGDQARGLHEGGPHDIQGGHAESVDHGRGEST
jgi:hypothetical protein